MPVQSRLQIGATLLAATVVLLLAGLWLARRLTAPMNHAVSVADQLAQGNLTVAIDPSGNEETVKLLTAMARMQGGFAGIVRGCRSMPKAWRWPVPKLPGQSGPVLAHRAAGQRAGSKLPPSMEELGSTVSQNADSARQANQLATQRLHRWPSRAARWWARWWTP